MAVAVEASPRTHPGRVVSYAAEDSPNGKPRVLVGNEVSRTVSIFQVDTSRP